MRVRFTPRARDDLAAILQYLDERSPQGALNVKRTLRTTIDLIGQYPQSGRLSEMMETRVLPSGRYTYLIYLSFEADEVWIVHIRHAKREPWNQEQG
jgi:toxin ParE1/3/4